MDLNEMIKKERLHPAYDRETKVAVFNKFLNDVADQELPEKFNETDGRIVFVLDDYEMSLTDGENHCKLNKDGKLEMYYHLPESGLQGFKDELLAKELYWRHGDIMYLGREGVISSVGTHREGYLKNYYAKMHRAKQGFYVVANHLNDALSKIPNLESFRKGINEGPHNWRFANSKSYISCYCYDRRFFKYGRIEDGEWIEKIINPKRDFFVKSDYEREKEALFSFFEQFEKDCMADLRVPKLENYEQVAGYLGAVIDDLPIEKIHDINPEYNRDELYNHLFDNYIGRGRKDLNQFAEVLKEYGLIDDFTARIPENFDHESGYDTYGWQGRREPKEWQVLDDDYVDVDQLEDEPTKPFRKRTDELEL